AAWQGVRPRPCPLRPSRLVRPPGRSATVAGHLPRHRCPSSPGRSALTAAGLAGPARRGGLPFAVRLRGRPARPTPRPPAARPPPPRAGRRRGFAPPRPAPPLSSPADPARPEKRHDRAAELAVVCGAELLSGGSIEPEQMPLWLNAANAVLVTSDYEGFGMAAVEALACDVPVLSTPVGIAPFALGGIDGCLCARFDAAAWAAVARPHLEAADPRVAGAARAAALSAPRMAERAIEAYRDVTATAVIDWARDER